MEKIKIYNQNVKVNLKGNVFKYISIDKQFPKISEVYFSNIKKFKIKAWKKNLSSNQFLYIIKGKIELIIYDDRVKKNMKLKKFLLGPKLKYSKILIPKNIWYGFKGLDSENLIVNSLSLHHKKCKIVNLDLCNNHIPYNWK